MWVLSQHTIKNQVPVHFSFSVGATQKENKRKIIARWIHREEDWDKKGQNEVSLGADWTLGENLSNCYVEIKCQLDATEVFIADLIACSTTCFGHHYAHHQELKSIIQWLLRVVFCAVVFSSSWSGVELYNTLELLMMGIVMPETCWASNKICNKNLCCI